MKQANNGINDQSGRPSTPSRRLSQMAENNRPNSPGTYGNYAQQDTETQGDKRSKLNQLLQNFFLKVAMTVIHTRMTVPPIIAANRNGTGSTVKKVNKWFSLELDETELFSRDLHIWKILNAYDPHQSPPPPLIIETILDASELMSDQTLVVLSNGRRHKVDSSEVVLERWKVVLGPSSTGQPFTEDLPVVYKKSIPVIRSVYSYACTMQLTNRLKKQLSKQVRQKGLKIRCRIRNGDEMRRDEYEAVESPLGDGMVGDTKSYNLGGVDCPVGFISVDVTHRDNCEFRVDSQESLLSSDFMNQDEYFFQPSLETRNSHRTGQLPYTTGREPSSAPTSGLSRPGPSVQQPISGLPVTNLATGERRIQHTRNVPSISSGSPLDPASSSYRSARESNLSLRSIDNAARRSSVSFSPFKTGSVASSPGAGVVGSRVSSGTSIPMRSRPSTGAGGPLPQRMSMPTPIDSSQSGYPSSGSPRPSSMRFSSSFTNRPPRFSGVSTNKADEDGASSGKGSVSSSSNAWAANFPDDSGHSITEDGKKISDFMKLLELTEKKGLKSFEQKTTVDPLSRFKKLRDTHAALSDSIVEPLNQSQTQQQQQSQPQQRPLSYPSASGLNSSLSSSTSPQLFQISPHTPHAPVIRSRLSEGLSAADAGLSEGRGSFHHRPRTESTSGPVSSSATPLDIPSSPRHRTISSFRRPNSFVQNKAVTDALEDLDDPATAFANAGRQSASLGTVDTAPVSLARMREDATNAPIDRPRDGAGINATSNLGATTMSGSSPSSSLRGRLSARGRGGWSGQNSGSASGGSGMRPGGFDDDDLLFTMSEDVMERRRISEEAGGKATGPASTSITKESTGLPNWTTNRRI